MLNVAGVHADADYVAIAMLRFSAVSFKATFSHVVCPSSRPTEEAAALHE